eukprot:gene16094-19151_t
MYDNVEDLNRDIEKTKTTILRSDVAYSVGMASLFALSIGCGDLKYTYELDPDFCVHPMFANYFFKFLFESILEGKIALKFDPMQTLHGEQTIRFYKMIPQRDSSLECSIVLKEAYDKGKAMFGVFRLTVSDKETKETYFEGDCGLFLRGIGGFGGDRGPTNSIDIPSQPPTAVHTYRTHEDTAKIYRLVGGDLNPLHIDQFMAEMAGFEKPILHGLCTYAVSGTAIIQHFCDNDPSRLVEIKARFSKNIFPGETIKTEMWRISDTEIYFQTRALERDGYALSNGIAIIKPTSSKL